MRNQRVLPFVLLFSGALITTSIGGCLFKSNSRNKAYDAVQVGDAEAAVIARFGTQPSVREKPGVLFARYASQRCDGVCAERLWYENRFSLDTEAWSIELDKSRHVIKKSRWVSP